MAPIDDHVAIAEVIQNQLRVSMLNALNAPGASVSETLATSIKEQSKAYKRIVDQKTWWLIIEDLKIVFKWGCDLGKLIIELEDHPTDSFKIMPTMFAASTELKTVYDEKAKKLVTKDVVPEFKGIPELVNAMFKEIVHLCEVPIPETEKDFQAKYSKTNIPAELEKVHKVFSPATLSNADVVNSIMFYAFNLAAVIMFRNGLQQGQNKSTDQRKEIVMLAEIVRITSSFGKVFSELDELKHKK